MASVRNVRHNQQQSFLAPHSREKNKTTSSYVTAMTLNIVNHDTCTYDSLFFFSCHK